MVLGTMYQDYFVCYERALKSICALKSKLFSLQRAMAFLEPHMADVFLFKRKLESLSNRSLQVEKRLLSRSLWKPYYSILRESWYRGLLILPLQDILDCHQVIFRIKLEVKKLYDQVGGAEKRSLLNRLSKLLREEISTLIEITSHYQSQALALVELHLAHILERERDFIRNFIFLSPGQETFEILNYRGIYISAETFLALRTLISRQGELEGREFTMIEYGTGQRADENISYLLVLLDLKEDLEQQRRGWNSLLYCNDNREDELA